MATGDFICFLDADDWLLPEGLEINHRYLQANAACAFVSGAYLFAQIQYPFKEIAPPQRLNLEQRSLVHDSGRTTHRWLGKIKLGDFGRLDPFSRVFFLPPVKK